MTYVPPQPSDPIAKGMSLPEWVAHHRFQEPCRVGDAHFAPGPQGFSGIKAEGTACSQSPLAQMADMDEAVVGPMPGRMTLRPSAPHPCCGYGCGNNQKFQAARGRFAPAFAEGEVERSCCCGPVAINWKPVNGSNFPTFRTAFTQSSTKELSIGFESGAVAKYVPPGACVPYCGTEGCCSPGYIGYAGFTTTEGEDPKFARYAHRISLPCCPYARGCCAPCCALAACQCTPNYRSEEPLNVDALRAFIQGRHYRSFTTVKQLPEGPQDVTAMVDVRVIHPGCCACSAFNDYTNAKTEEDATAIDVKYRGSQGVQPSREDDDIMLGLLVLQAINDVSNPAGMQGLKQALNYGSVSTSGKKPGPTGER